ncbi:hypothetical protein F5Y15DRAFT_427973 [Xylariaceae sp. FL0016]|nr:hypothetical protein F5Y15DRAFT_427973 [Xylariaceae sp. FL0016]
MASFSEQPFLRTMLFLLGWETYPYYTIYSSFDSTHDRRPFLELLRDPNHVRLDALLNPERHLLATIGVVYSSVAGSWLLYTLTGATSLLDVKFWIAWILVAHGTIFLALTWLATKDVGRNNRFDVRIKETDIEYPECCICRENEDVEDLCFLHCNPNAAPDTRLHVMHSTCAQGWWAAYPQNRGKCPLCNQKPVTYFRKYKLPVPPGHPFLWVVYSYFTRFGMVALPTYSGRRYVQPRPPAPAPRTTQTHNGRNWINTLTAVVLHAILLLYRLLLLWRVYRHYHEGCRWTLLLVIPVTYSLEFLVKAIYHGIVETGHFGRFPGIIINSLATWGQAHSRPGGSLTWWLFTYLKHGFKPAIRLLRSLIARLLTPFIRSVSVVCLFWFILNVIIFVVGGAVFIFNLVKIHYDSHPSLRLRAWKL